MITALRHNQPMLDNIPSELRERAQWLVWRYEDKGSRKPTKVPYDAKGKFGERLASVNDDKTWSNFIVACTALHSLGYDGVGFVFSASDPYTFIDLDDCQHLSNGDPNPNYQVDLDRQIKIFREFNSYSEISPGGKGLHIIVKGAIGAGRKRSFIEVYSSQRYATMTGNVHLNVPIIEQQDKLTQLWEQMGAGKIATQIFEGDKYERFTDEQIINQGLNAINGDKFKTLLEGKFIDLYQSQSEADLAFVDIIAFYTQNKAQIKRIYKNSILGNTDKKRHRDDYIETMISKSFDKMLPQLDFDGFKNALEEKIVKQKPKGQLELEITTEQEVESSVPKPPGLMGEIAEFIYHAAPQPVQEIALAGAIGFMAGICGRAYNVSNTGLNQYVLLLAKTGMGKEAMRSGIDKLMNSIRLQVPTSDKFIGPNHISSGQALIKYIHKKSNCFVSIIGEFGITLHNMANPNASPHDRVLMQALLELYNQSGHTDVYRASIQADMDKNTDITMAPNFSLLGDSQPSTFYDNLNEDMILKGLLPRFMLIEYHGKRYDLNEHAAHIQPSPWLIEKLASLVEFVEQLMKVNKVINVKFADDAYEMSINFSKYATAMINKSQDDVVLHLWNRAHLKAIKFAALIAVGCNMSDPIITVEYLKISIGMVQKDIKNLLRKFEKGEVGHNVFEAKQNSDLIKAIKDYMVRDWSWASRYVDTPGMHQAKVIPYAYLCRRLHSQISFRNDRYGSTKALQRAIQVLLDSDKLREIGKTDLARQFGTTQRAFMVSNVNILNDD